MQAFSVDAARALGGPDWLVARRVAAAQAVAAATKPTTDEEVWRYSRVGELDLGRFRPVPVEELNAPGDERAPGGGPWALEVGKHAGMLVVRDGRVVRHELDPALVEQGVRVCDIATCDVDPEVQAAFGSVVADGSDYYAQLPAAVPGRCSPVRSTNCQRHGLTE